eukprot:218857_1
MLPGSFICLFLMLTSFQQMMQSVQTRYNVLFVAVDDLRTELGGPYGQQDLIYTPNLEAMMDRAFTFTHAYTQCAICAATRASFLTGQRPDTTRIWNIGPYFRNTMVNGTGKNVYTLPMYFKDYANYYTVGAGKVFHPGPASGGSNTQNSCFIGDDEPYSWSEPYWDCSQSAWGRVNSAANNGCSNSTGCVQSQECVDCLTKYGCYKPANNTEKLNGPAVCPFNCSDQCVNDGLVSSQILKYFKNVSTDKNKQPFFIGVGMKRPHLPFDAPDYFYDMYPSENIDIAKYNKPPKNMPIYATNNCTEIKDYDDINPDSLDYIPWKWGNKQYTISLVNDSYQHKLRQGYYAAVSFMDMEFGKIIQGLYEYNLWNNTIIAITGDHGWHLGEQGCWTKLTNFEVALRVPLIIRVPGMNEGKYSDILVEQLDIMPTIIDAAGIGFNENVTKQLEGKSLLDIIKNPENPPHFEQYAYSQYPRGTGINSTKTNPNFTVMGLSMRTTQWRYTEWLHWNVGSTTEKPYPVWDIVYGIELYNHSNKTIDENDMNAYDNYNLAYEEEMQNVVEDLHENLYHIWDNQTWG